MASTTWQFLGFVAVSLGPVAVSRRSLGRAASHGFPRFFAWEAIAALFFVNAPWWFVEPLAWNQLVAWTLLGGCLVPLLWGSVLLAGRGRPTASRAAADPTRAPPGWSPPASTVPSKLEPF